jgi:hypothetical protein
MATRVNSTYVGPDVLAEFADADVVTDAIRLEMACVAGSRTVDAICGRPSVGGAIGGFWYIASGTATFRPDAAIDMETRTSYPAPIGDWSTITSVATSTDGGSTWGTVATTSWQAEPLNASLMGEVYTHVRLFDDVWPDARAFPGRPSLRVIGNLGWGTVPSEVEQAAKLCAVRWFKRPDAPFGVAGFADLGAMYVRGSDPDVERILDRLIWRGGAVT